MNHRELHASKLVMSRGDKGTDWDDYADSAETGKAGTRGPKNKKLMTMTTARAATKVKALKMYTSKGCAKFGLYFFAAFILLPDWIQVSLLDVIVPTAIGSVVYGNYQLYMMREWSPFTIDLGILVIICSIVAYVKHKRHKKRLLMAHTDHAKHYRKSVMLEMATLQLQSKPGTTINQGIVKKHVERVQKEGLNVSTGEEEDEEVGRVVSPLAGMQRGQSGPLDFIAGKSKGKHAGKDELSIVPLDSPGGGRVAL